VIEGAARERECGNRAKADGSTTGERTRSKARNFKDAASHQTSDDDNSPGGNIRDGRTYVIYGTVAARRVCMGTEIKGSSAAKYSSKT